MKTLFLSDVHLGSPLFEDEIVITHLLESPDFNEIVLVGDIIDEWENEAEDILHENKNIIDKIFEVSIDKRVTYVLGNHDPDKGLLSKYLPFVDFCESYIFKDGIVIHGHQFDDLIIKHYWLARILFYFHWSFERFFRCNLKAFFREIFFSIASKRDANYYIDLILDIEKDAVEKYKDYKYIIMGHTHMPKISLTTPQYINCGDWIHNRSYVVYDNETSEFTLKL